MQQTDQASRVHNHARTYAPNPFVAGYPQSPRSLSTRAWL